MDADYFLGGQVKLDREAALKALKETVADPLGLDVYEAGAGVLQIINGEMNDLLRTMVASKGYDTHDFTMLYYGGAGPVHMYGFAEDIEFQDIITLPWAAGFSAFGAACSEYMHRYNKGVRLMISPNPTESELQDIAGQISQSWEALRSDAIAELEAEGISKDDVKFRYGVSARYTGQIESFDTDLPNGNMGGGEDVRNMISAFEAMYSKVYPEGAKFSGAGYSLTEVNLEAIASKPLPILLKHELRDEQPESDAYVGERDVYHKDSWCKFKVWEMSKLTSGNKILGPAIIRDPMTTVVIPPEHEMSLDEYLVLHYTKSS